MNETAVCRIINAVTDTGHLHDMESGAVLGELNRTILVVFLNRVPERGRHVLAGSPAKLTAIHAVTGLRVRHGERTEILTRLRALQNIFGESLGLGDIRSGIGRNQNVADVILGRRGTLALRGKIRVDLGLRNMNLGIHFTLTETLRHDFTADLFTERGKRDTVLREIRLHLGDSHFVIRGDLLDCGAHHRVIHTDADLAGMLLNRLIHDQLIKNLPAEHVHRRQLDVLTAEIERRDMGLLLQFKLSNDVVIHDCGDFIERAGAFSGFHRRGSLGCRGCCGCRRGRERARRCALGGSLQLRLSSKSRRGSSQDDKREAGNAEISHSIHTVQSHWVPGSGSGTRECFPAIRKQDWFRPILNHSVQAAGRKYCHICL